MRLENFTTSELSEKLMHLEERMHSLRKIMKNIKNPDAIGTLQIQLDVYKLTKVQILEEMSKRRKIKKLRA